jgi:hypothetical protein
VAVFFVARVQIVHRKGSHMVHVGLSRTAKAFPVALFKERVDGASVRCPRRICGAYSLIEAEDWLPKAAILAVGQELRERIIVRVLAKKTR